MEVRYRLLKDTVFVLKKIDKDNYEPLYIDSKLSIKGICGARYFRITFNSTLQNDSLLKMIDMAKAVFIKKYPEFVQQMIEAEAININKIMIEEPAILYMMTIGKKGNKEKFPFVNFNYNDIMQHIKVSELNKIEAKLNLDEYKKNNNIPKSSNAIEWIGFFIERIVKSISTK